MHHDLLKLCANEESLQSAKSYNLCERLLNTLDRLRDDFPQLTTNSELVERAQAFSSARSDEENVHYERMVRLITRRCVHYAYTDVL